MKVRSIRCFLAAMGTAAAMVLVAGCEQQAPGDQAPAVSASAALTQGQVVPTGSVCTPTGKHVKHAGFACTACHMCAGTLSFDPAVAGATATFDATTKNCSNVACHAVPAGTFTYSYWDWGLDQSVSVSVPYGGAGGGSAANWYATSGASCGACHGYPPTYGGTAYPWHNGQHGLGIPNGNACQLCHPDATGAYVFGGPPSFVTTSAGLITSCAPGTFCSAPGTITNASRHGNGVVDVTPLWRSTCSGCH